MKKPKYDLGYPLYLNAPVMQSFGQNPEFYKKFGQKGHNGIDLGAVAGVPVLAVADGVIRWAEDGGPEPLMGSAAGNCILIEHNGYPETAGSFMSGYAHLSLIYVTRGEHVTKGSVIGLVGATGATTGPHLHIELMPAPLNIKNGYWGRVDPAPYIGQPIGTGR